MSTRTKCVFGGLPGDEGDRPQNFVMYELTTESSGKKHIGFFDGGTFYILCGTTDCRIAFNPKNVYDMSTLRRLTEKFTVEFN